MLAYFCGQDQHHNCTTRVSVPVDEPCSCSCHENVLVKVPVVVCTLWVSHTKHRQHVFHRDLETTTYAWCPGLE